MSAKCVRCGDPVEEAWSLRCKPCFRAEFVIPAEADRPELEPEGCPHGHSPTTDDPECFPCRDRLAWNAAIAAALEACFLEEDRIRRVYRAGGAVTGLGSEKVASVVAASIRIKDLRK